MYYFKVGIVSGVNDCSSGHPTGYGVYTEVSKYVDWINEVIESN